MQEVSRHSTMRIVLFARNLVFGQKDNYKISTSHSFKRNGVGRFMAFVDVFLSSNSKSMTLFHSPRVNEINRPNQCSTHIFFYFFVYHFTAVMLEHAHFFFRQMRPTRKYIPT